MQSLGIHHCAIICSDYRKSKHFYVDLLGFRIIHEAYRADRHSYKLDLQIGDDSCGQIELFSFPEPPERPTRPEARGLRHLAFSVGDVGKAVRELEEQGIETEPVRMDEFTGKPFTFFRDPDNLPLELYQK
ncbi:MULTISPECIES: SMU1112c/YaeR family gloxylase I-like metalloprotein [unclassified Sporolactobacillus]|uniref:SMU1112c/YaeR family gloxylase I-like metalloprotein n=1 Tax=unclassified Sporolactobacillus TaxID=2628533 RepID=UPI00236898AA|nr:VOC family protein [Sporolactobacillus sp. CQH2019]MDD9148598.1 VOC family protein [Sporolactobacillus sp. CQH2019]